MAKPKTTQRDRDFTRGYYCAVAALVQMHGASQEASDLMGPGGDVNDADPQDIEVLREHGLIYDITEAGNHG